MTDSVSEIKFYFPTGTLPVSVTGKNCQLSCLHCNGRYLQSMIDIKDIINIDDIPSTIKSLLISGGCNQKGIVPIDSEIDKLNLFHQHNYRLNIHPGLAGYDQIMKLSRFTSVFSFDFIYDNETIHKVYQLEKTGKDYLEAFNNLNILANVVPHICIGIYGGKIKGEYIALEILAQYKPAKLVLLVFVPTKGTEFEKCSPPALEDIEKAFKFAREKFPSTEINLGCMHPRGKYKAALEEAAHKYSFNGYVNPSMRFREMLRNEGCKTIIKKECCAFD